MGKKLVISGLPDGAGPGDIVGAFTNEAGIDGRLIGKISFWGKRVIVEVDKEIYSRVIRIMDGNSIAGHRVQVTSEEGLEQLENYVQRFLRLVQMEREEDLERFLYEVKKIPGSERQKRGRALLHLHVQNWEQLEAGGYLFRFAQNRGDYILRTEISLGDWVILSRGDPLSSYRQQGMVYALTRKTITLYFTHSPQEWVMNERLRIDLYMNEELFFAIFSALKALKAPGDYSSRLCDILLGFEEPVVVNQEGTLTFFDPLLNPEQKKAVRRALLTQDYFLIQGGPGTGKTRVLQEIICQKARQGESILVVMPTIGAAVKMMNALNEKGVEAALVGFPFQEEDSLQSVCCTLQSDEPDQELREDSPMQEEEEEGQGQSTSCYQLAHNRDFDSIPVLCTTSSHCSCPILSTSFFDLLIIDDAVQMMEPLTLIPILKTTRVIMAGDKNSLSPQLIHSRAGKEGLTISLFERLLDLFGERISTALTRQYRMTEVLGRFIHQSFYSEDRIMVNEKIFNGEMNIKELPGCTPGSTAVNRKESLIFFDTSMMKARESSLYNHCFFENPVEADLVVEMVSSFLQAGLEPSSIGVITPYPEQSNLIRKAIALEGILVNKPYKFLGEEKDLIILSFVRNNEKGWLGPFLKDIRSMNLALSRARHKVIMVGSEKTISRHPFYESLIEYVKEYGYFYPL